MGQSDLSKCGGVLFGQIAIGLEAIAERNKERHHPALNRKEVEFPTHLESLLFGYSFNQPLAKVKLPRGLRRLSPELEKFGRIKNFRVPIDTL